MPAHIEGVQGSQEDGHSVDSSNGVLDTNLVIAAGQGTGKVKRACLNSQEALEKKWPCQPQQQRLEKGRARKSQRSHCSLRATDRCTRMMTAELACLPLLMGTL